MNNRHHREIAILMGLIALVGFVASAHAYLQKSAGDAVRSELAAIYATVDEGAQRSNFDAARDVLDKEFTGTMNGQQYYRDSLAYYYDKRTARGRGRTRHYVTNIDSIDVTSTDRAVAQVTAEEMNGRNRKVKMVHERTDVWVRRDLGWKKLSSEAQNTRYFVDGTEIDRDTFMREYRPKHRGGNNNCRKPCEQTGSFNRPLPPGGNCSTTTTHQQPPNPYGQITDGNVAPPQPQMQWSSF